MSRNNSGTYTLPPSNPVVNGTVITSEWANATMPDLGNEITDSLSRSGNGGMLAALKHTAGTNTAPSSTFTSDPQSGDYLFTTSEIRRAVATVDSMRWRPQGVEVWVVDAWYPLVNSKTAGGSIETQTITDVQTVVAFTANIAGASIYLNGTSGDRGRLLLDSDYTYDSVLNEITLATTYPNDTMVTASYHDDSDVNAAAAAAAASAIASADSAAASAATFVAFSAVYLGAKASDPTLDNEGAALITGALYFNTTDNVMKEYTGTAWIAVTSVTATLVTYDNSTSGLSSTNVQGAIDELDGKIDAIAPPPSWGLLTTDATLTAGQRVMVDTTLGIITITLPATPAANNTAIIADYAGTFVDFNCVVGRNGENIMGLAEDMNLDSNNLSVEFTYIDATQGWRMTS